MVVYAVPDLVPSVASMGSHAAPKLWAGLRGTRRFASTTAEAVLSARAELAAAQMEKLSRRGIVMERQETDDSVAFWKQGDIQLNSAAAHQERMRLRSSPRVRDALHSFWLMVPKRKRQGPPFGFPVEVVEELGYTLLMQEAYQVLADDDDWDGPELNEQIKEDWAIDADGLDHMTRERFCDALFELADMWTVQIDEGVYADFLHDLAARVLPGLEEEKARSPVAVRSPPPLVKRASASSFAGYFEDVDSSDDVDHPEAGEPLGGHKVERESKLLATLPPRPVPLLRQQRQRIRTRDKELQSKRRELVRSHTRELQSNAASSPMGGAATDVMPATPKPKVLPSEGAPIRRPSASPTKALNTQPPEQPAAPSPRPGLIKWASAMPVDEPLAGGVFFVPSPRTSKKRLKAGRFNAASGKKMPVTLRPLPQQIEASLNCWWAKLQLSERPLPGSVGSAVPSLRRVPGPPRKAAVTGDEWTWIKSGQTCDLDDDGSQQMARSQLATPRDEELPIAAPATAVAIDVSPKQPNSPARPNSPGEANTETD